MGDRLRAALRLLGLDAPGAEEPSAGAVAPPEPPGGETRREDAPERRPGVPPAIAFELERGLGWPQRHQGRALPGRGPLVVRREPGEGAG